MDNTEQFFRDLTNPAKYRVVCGVPVFKPHERVLPSFKAPDGKVYPEIKIRVTDQDLSAIAVVTNQAGPQPITEGHRNLDPNFPEKDQPRKVGWETNHRPGLAVLVPGGKPEPCILADLCYEADLYEEVGPRRYPFRSADFDFHEKKLVGLALLVRRPFLELGMIPYSRERNVIQYAMGDSDADDKTTPEEEAQYQKMCRYFARYFKTTFPKMAQFMDDAGSTGTATYQADADLARKLAVSESERLLDKVAGKVKFDRAKEVATLSALPEADRPKHVQYMLDNYAKLPTGTQDVQIATGTVAGGGKQPTHADGTPAMTRQQADAAVQYALANKIPHEAARLWALANIPPG